MIDVVVTNVQQYIILLLTGSMRQPANAQLKDSSFCSGDTTEFKHHASTSSAQLETVQNVMNFFYIFILSVLAC